MKRHTKSNECKQPAPGPRHRGFVYFLMTVATIWATLVFAAEGYATTGTMKNIGEAVHNLNLADSNPGTKLEFQALEQPIISSQLSKCCGHTKDHKQMADSCQTSCPPPGDTLSANRAWLLPTHALLAMRFAPLVVGTPDSLLHQRLNRPPITGHSA